MFLLNLNGPQIAFSSSGGGGGGGGSSSSSKSPTRPKARPAAKPATKTSGGGKGSKPKSTSGGRNLDADMAAGSTYAPTKNAGTSKAKQSTYTGGTNGPSRKLVPLTKNTPINSKTSVTAKDLKAGNVSTFKSKNGSGSITVARGTKLKDVPTVNVGVNGNKTVKNEDAYDSKDVAAPIAAPTKSSSPVTAPETTDPSDGVGGGRDGGGSAKRKASKANEDNLSVKRRAEGVKGYKREKSANPMAIKGGNK